MLSSSRVHYLALGGCLAFLLLAIPALGQEPAPTAANENIDAAPGNRFPDTVQEPGPDNQLAPETEPASSGEVGGQPVEPIANQSHRYPNCEFDSVEECDLAAQQSMADSTAYMNNAAWVGVTLTVLGLALLWRTMRYTKDAARYAERAADAAWETVEEARKATAATRDANNILTLDKRPWLEINRRFECKVEESEKGVTIAWRYKYTNHGLSPATNVRMNQRPVRFSTPYALHEVAEKFYSEAWARRDQHSGTVVYQGPEEGSRDSQVSGQIVSGETGELALIIAVTYRFALGGGYGMEAQTFILQPSRRIPALFTHELVSDPQLQRTS